MSPAVSATGGAKRPERLRDVAPPLRWLILSVTAIGLVVVTGCLLHFGTDRIALFVQMVALALLTSTVKLRLPLKSNVSTLSVSNALTFAAILLLDTPGAVIIGAVSGWSQCTFRMRSRNPWHRTAFSVATLSLAAYVSAEAFDLMLGLTQALPAASRMDAIWAAGFSTVLGAMMVAALLHFGVNTILVALAVALSTRQRLLRVWLDAYLWSAPGYFVAGAAACGALSIDRFSQWGALLAVPLYLTYRSYRTFILRIEDERAQVRLMSDVQLATIEALALAIEVKDQTSQSHIQRFQIFAEGLARALHLEDDEVRAVKTAALLHDIGNLAVPEHILSKPGALTAEEFRRLQVHPRVGADIVDAVPFPYPVAPLILAHHEHWDGSGYPMALRADEIPIGARIITTVDYFTALLADRPYRAGLPFEDAVSITRQAAGHILDPSLVETFVACLPDLERRVREEHAAGLARRQIEGRRSMRTESALEDIAGTQRESKVLYEIAQTLGSSLALDDTFRMLAERLEGLIPYSACALFLPEGRDGLLACGKACGLGGHDLLRLPPLSLDALSTTPVVAERLGSVAFTDALVAPLLLGDTTVGALAVYSLGAERYGPEDRRLLDLVAQHAAAIVQKSVVFEQTQEASLTDPLTGLANRRAIQQHLANLAAAPSPAPYAVLLLDLDGLKYLNDTFGHHVGDRAIREVARVLRLEARAGEVSARYAGDEFVVVIVGATLEHASVRAAAFQHAISAARVDVGTGEAIHLSISVGAAACPEDATTPEALTATADVRMYHNKAQQKRRRATDAAGLDAA